MTREVSKDKKWLYWLIGLGVLVVIIIVIWFLFRGTEIRTSEEPGIHKTVATECVSDKQDGAFFAGRAESVLHTIKSTFRNNVLDRISYNYDAIFATDALANANDASFHGQYNKYMASKGLDPDSLKPVFSSSGNSVKITLITEIAKLSNDNIRFFFLNMDNFQRIRSYSPKELTTLYQGKGFSCEVHD